MVPKQVSPEQTRVISLFLTNPQRWFTVVEIEKEADVADSTARAFGVAYFRMKILERVEPFGGYKYRLSPDAVNDPYVKQVLQLLEICSTEK
jgi:hypothetical protein